MKCTRKIMRMHLPNFISKYVYGFFSVFFSFFSLFLFFFCFCFCLESIDLSVYLFSSSGTLRVVYIDVCGPQLCRLLVSVVLFFECFAVFFVVFFFRFSSVPKLFLQ